MTFWTFQVFEKRSARVPCFKTNRFFEGQKHRYVQAHFSNSPQNIGFWKNPRFPDAAGAGWEKAWFGLMATSSRTTSHLQLLHPTALENILTECVFLNDSRHFHFAGFAPKQVLACGVLQYIVVLEPRVQYISQSLSFHTLKAIAWQKLHSFSWQSTICLLLVVSFSDAFSCGLLGNS